MAIYVAIMANCATVKENIKRRDGGNAEGEAMIYDVLTAEKYTDKAGWEQARFFTVGTAFENRNGEGFNIEIPPGIAISGRVFLRPRKDRDSKEAYDSAADQFEA